MNIRELTEDVLTLREYNQNIFNSICNENPLKQAINEFYTTKIDKLVKGPTFSHAFQIEQLSFSPFTFKDEDFTYEVLSLLPYLRCSAILNTTLIQIEQRQNEQLKKMLTVLSYDEDELKNLCDESDKVGIYYFGYKQLCDYMSQPSETYSAYLCSNTNNATTLSEQEYFINLVNNLILAKGTLSFVNDFQINDTNLIKDVRTATSHNMKVELLKNAIDYQYSCSEKPEIANLLKLKDEKTFHSITNFLKSQKAVRQSIWKYRQNTLSWEENKFFILLLAFYIGLPLFNDIEEFMNMHGHTLKSPVLELKTTRNATSSLISDKDIRYALEHGVASRCILEVLKK